MSSVIFFWTGIWIHVIESNSKLCNILQCVLLKTVKGKDWEHSFTEPDLKQRISK